MRQAMDRKSQITNLRFVLLLCLLVAGCSATNAAIHWYVLGSSSQRNEVIHYAGTGFVSVDASSRSADLDIMRADLKMRDHAGDLIDPIGDCRITGSASADANNAMVEQYL